MTPTSFLLIIGLGLAAAAAAHAIIKKHWNLASEPSGQIRSKSGRKLPLLEMVKKLGAASPVHSANVENYRSKLLQAGLHLDLNIWRGLQMLCCATGIFLALALTLHSHDSAHIFLALVISFLGVFGPRLVLSSLARDRKSKIEAEMASTLELLSLAVKSGYPLERGIKLVGQSTDGALSEEFRQIDTDINLLGMDLTRALDRMRKRCGVSSLNSFAVALTQASQQGSSVVRILESQAREARNNHYATQLEQINKLPAKLVAPIFGIMLLIIVIALVPPIYDTVVLFSGSYSSSGDLGAISTATL